MKVQEKIIFFKKSKLNLKTIVLERLFPPLFDNKW